MLTKILASAALVLSVTAAPTLAQNVNANNLVNVNIAEPLLENIANDLSVDVSQISAIVQVPVGIAANICDVDANVLAQARKNEGGAQCDAMNTSDALTKAVQKSMKKG